MITKVKALSFHISGLLLGLLFGRNVDKIFMCDHRIENYSFSRMALPYPPPTYNLLDRSICTVLSPVFLVVFLILSLFIGIIALLEQKNAEKHSKTR